MSRVSIQSVYRYFLYDNDNDTYYNHDIPIIVSVGKKRHKYWSMVKSETAAPVVIGTTLRTTGPVPASGLSAVSAIGMQLRVQTYI